MASNFLSTMQKFEQLLGQDADDEILKMADDIFKKGSSDVEKGAACIAVAKLRLKTELLMHETHGDHSGIENAAKEAVSLFEKSGEQLPQAYAYNVLAQAALISDDTPQAIKHAKTASKIASAGGDVDNALFADIQDTLYQAYMSQGNQAKALAAVKERASLLEKARPGSQALVDALAIVADLQLKRNLKDAAKQTAEKMETLAKELGDKEKEGAAKKSISLALVQAGKADEAPNRAKAMQALECCVGAVESKNEDSFRKWWIQAEAQGAVSQKDIKEKLSELKEKLGEEELEKHLVAVNAPWSQKMSKGQSETVINEFTKRTMYFIYRGIGGIQYGPRYQAVRGFRVGDMGGPAMSTLRPTSQSESWELNLGYHTGILDGSLQSGSLAGVDGVY